MELLPYSDDDLALTEALESDPEVMRELGGPVPRADLLAIHRKRVSGSGDGGDWWLKIVPEPGGPPAGTIGIWPTRWKGSEIHETGWMVLPEFQGHGIASAALELLLSRARSEPHFERVHAFPAVTNAPSNALCRKFGFVLTGECDVTFRDRPLRVNHWELDLG